MNEIKINQRVGFTQLRKSGETENISGTLVAYSKNDRWAFIQEKLPYFSKKEGLTKFRIVAHRVPVEIIHKESV